MNKLPLLKKSDLIIIGILLLAALIMFIPSAFSNNDFLTAVITADGEIFTEIALDGRTNEEIEINGTVIVADGKSVYFKESDCPDKTCVRTGILEKSGASSACIPNRVSVYIEGEKSDIDIMAY